MKNISIVFTKSRTKFPIFSWIIRAYTRKPYSHVAIKLANMFYQSPSGYHSEHNFLAKYRIERSYEIQICDDIYEDIKKECDYYSGYPYSVLQNLGIVLVDFLKIFNKKIKNPWPKGANCSEIVYKCLIIKLWRIKKDKDAIKPHHIEQILIDNNVKLTI
jgi:hypothetical protein